MKNKLQNKIIVFLKTELSLLYYVIKFPYLLYKVLTMKEVE